MTPLDDSLRPALAAVLRVIGHYLQRGVVIGGVAVSLLGNPRTTVDVDAVLLSEGIDLEQLLTIAAAAGLAPRIADAETFARRNRILLLRHVETGVPVDLSLAFLPFEVEMVERALVAHVAGLAVRIPTPEDLIIMKAVAHRPRDLDDISYIVETHPDLDRERIRFWVEQFAEALEMPELWDDTAALLS